MAAKKKAENDKNFKALENHLARANALLKDIAGQASSADGEDGERRRSTLNWFLLWRLCASYPNLLCP